MKHLGPDGECDCEMCLMGKLVWKLSIALDTERKKREALEADIARLGLNS